MDTTVQLPTYSFAKSQGVIVGEITEEGALIYHLEAASLQALSEVKRMMKIPLILKPVDKIDFQKQLARVYEFKSSILDAAGDMEEEGDLHSLADQLPMSEDLLEAQDDAPVIRLLNAIFTQAIKQGASDIHIETYETQVLVRNRIDGVLQSVLEVQKGIAPLLTSRVKVMAKLDIAEKRVPQDGRISLRIGGHTVDVRVSTLPSNHGERVVMRILDKQAAQLDLNLLGMPQDNLISMRKMIAQPHGIILITGPTGSGKTTSLYAMLTELNEITRNILTIEDPIEYDLRGIGQTQVNTKIQMTFAKGLRAILRQDPDVVMIGEIRDLETAEIAIQASLTGHLVLSTLHTNTALGAIPRLCDMGVEPFLLSSSIVGLLAQRLVRKLCDTCKAPHLMKEEERIIMELPETDTPATIYEAVGCTHCNNLGYKGRTGIYEIIPMDEHLRGLIHRNEGVLKMEQYVRAEHASVRQDGFKRVLRGDTTLAEILRVSSEQ